MRLVQSWQRGFWAQCKEQAEAEPFCLRSRRKTNLCRIVAFQIRAAPAAHPLNQAKPAQTAARGRDGALLRYAATYLIQQPGDEALAA